MTLQNMYIKNAALTSLEGILPTDSNFIVGNGTKFVAESGATARTSLGVAIGTDVQAHGDVLDDFNTLTAAASDGQFIVATGAGVFAYESGSTALLSLGATASDGSVAYTATGVGFRDEDDMLSNDATAPPSQQSVSAFLYSQLTYDGDVLTYDGDVLTYV